MKALDKIYVCAAHPTPFWFSDKQIPNMIEYIRKDALLEWANEQIEVAKANNLAYSPFEKLIDKLNSM